MAASPAARCATPKGSARASYTTRRGTTDSLPRERFTFLETRGGKSRSPKGFGNEMRKWCDAAGLPKCTSHGLRKAIARRLAEAGASPHEIMAVTGHSTLEEVNRYTRAANRHTLADDAMNRLK